ncbi:MAG: hypothetical protein ACNS64_07215, partial [Candidatus Halalkalibacterium sp. M3_1C_030]
MKQTYLLLLATLLAIGCSSKTDLDSDSAKGYQAISVLGDTLYAPELEPDTEAQFKTNLQSAKAQYEANTDDADALIWYGRRTAYLGNYRKAIDIYTE